MGKSVPDPKSGTPRRKTGETESAAPWRGVLVLAFGAFAIGTDEFVLAGVLPELGDSLSVGITTAGQVVTVFALTCAVMAPPGHPHRGLAASQSAQAVRADLPAGRRGDRSRALVPRGPGGPGRRRGRRHLYIPAASVTASALMGPERRGRAIAAVTTGLTAATALGAPIGTVVGSVLDWRATMWFIALLAVLSLFGVFTLVPAVVAGAPGGLRRRLAPLGDRRVVAVLAATLVAFTAAYIVYTYMAEVFHPATGGDGRKLAILMFAFGLTGMVGNFYAGTLADRFGARVVVGGAVTLLAASLLVLPLATGSFAAAAVVIVVYGIAAWGITAPQQSRLISSTRSRRPS
ncbi:MFS transporter [Streptomyces nogalater]